MKVFISWSGHVSHRVALVFRDWLPSILQSVEPYVSSEDIDKGARWSTDISRELEDSSYGIICVTRSNVAAPWLNFEAGALSKSFEKGRVSPFLFGLERSEVPPGPLLQFQSTIFDHDDILKLVTSLNAACTEQKLEPTRLERVFDVWWPELEKTLRDVESIADADPSGTPPRDAEELLSEVVELVRSQQRLLSSPEELLPPGYIEWVLGERAFNDISPAALDDLARGWEHLQEAVFRATEDGEAGAAIPAALDELETPVRYLLNRGRVRQHRFRPRTTMRPPSDDKDD